MLRILFFTLMLLLTLGGCSNDGFFSNGGGKTIHISLAMPVATQASMQNEKSLTLASHIIDQLIKSAWAAPVAQQYPQFSQILLHVSATGYDSAKINSDFNNNKFSIAKGGLVVTDTEFQLSVPEIAPLTIEVSAYKGGYRFFKGVTVLQLADLSQVTPPAVAVQMKVSIDESIPVTADKGCADSDQDGLCNQYEDLFTAADGAADIDGDGIINSLDTDSDGDGTLDKLEGITEMSGFPAFVYYKKVNNAPVLANVQIQGNEDETFAAYQLLATDVDGDTLRYSLISQPKNGQVTVTERGGVIFTPAKNYHGTDNFSVLVKDGIGGEATATITLVVNPVNDSPIAVNQNFSGQEDKDIVAKIVATDVDNDPLSYEKISDPQHGAVTIQSDGSFTYIPQPDYFGNDSFQVKVNDGTVSSDAVIITLEITKTNDAPRAESLPLQTNEDTAVEGRILVTDPDGDALGFSIGTNPAHGTAAVTAAGIVSYTPAADFHGNDAFAVLVTDSQGGSVSASVQVTITAKNDAPVVSNQAFSGQQESTLTATLIATDVDGDNLTFAKVTDPQNGTVTLQSNGVFTYIPVTGFFAVDSFQFSVSDGIATSSAIITLEIARLNTAPVAQDLTLTTDEDNSVSGAVIATDSDSDQLTYSISTQPIYGIASVVATGDVTYQPNANYNGTDGFSVVVSDGYGGSVNAQITITIAPINDIPIVLDSSHSGTVNQPINGLYNVTDVDNDIITFTVIAPPLHGTLADQSGTISTINHFSYQPDTNYVGNDQFEVEFNDGNGGVVTAVYNITIAQENIPPVVASLSLVGDEDTTLTGNLQAIDLNQDTLIFTIISYPEAGNLTVSATGDVSYTPNSNYYGTDGATISVDDGNGGVTNANISITVNPVNDLPQLQTSNLFGAIGETLAGTFIASDAENEAVTFAVDTQPLNGTLTLDSAGNYSYTPNAEFFGSDPFSILLTDASNGTATANVSVEISSGNLPPVITPLELTGTENSVLSGRVTATDPEGDSVSFGIVSQPLFGAATFDTQTNTISYTPNAGYFGGDILYIYADDGINYVNGEVKITITNINDAPQILRTTFEISKNRSLDASVLAYDPDNEQLQTVVTTSVQNGTLTIDSQGFFRYQPNADYVGSDGFALTVTDGAGLSDSATVTINVVNDSDNDGLLDSVETTAGTNSATADSDGDGYTDKHEIAAGSNPMDSASVPAGTDIATYTSINSNTTWTLANSPYRLSASVDISAGAALDIEAGVVVKSGAGVALYVYGELNAVATDAQPVIFTALNDDSVGGDSDGVVDAPVAGEWSGIYFETNSYGVFTNVMINYANTGIYFYGSSPYLENIAINHSYYGLQIYGDYYNNATSPVIGHIDINDIAYHAIYISDYYGAISNARIHGFSNVTGSANNAVIVVDGKNTHPVMSGITTNGGTYSLQFYNGAAGIYTESQFIGASIASVYMEGNSQPQFDASVVLQDSLISYELNGQMLPATVGTEQRNNITNIDQIAISGTLATNATMAADPLGSGQSVWVLSGDIGISDNITLTIEEGTVIKAKNSNTSINVYGDNDNDGIGGNLTILGSSTNPVMLTSYQDDTVVGDSNGDADATSPAYYDWDGIFFNAGSSGSVQHVRISYTSYGIKMEGASPTIDNVAISNSYYGMYLYSVTDMSTAPLISNVTITDSYANALYLDGYYALVTPQFSNVQITRTTGSNTGYADIYMVRQVDASMDGISVTSSNHYNLQLSNGANVTMRNSSLTGATVATLRLESGSTVDVDSTVTVADSPTAVQLNGSAFPSGVIQLTKSNIANGKTVEISGTYTTDVTLAADPLQTGDSVWHMVGTITVADNATMTLAAGTIIKSKNGSDLYIAADSDSSGVGGTLLVNGTNASPVIITSLYDDTVAGDSNEDLDATTPASGNWGEIRFNEKSAGTISNLMLKYGGMSIYISGASPTITNVQTDTSSHGLYMEGRANTVTAPDISDYTITNSYYQAINLYGYGGVVSPQFSNITISRSAGIYASYADIFGSYNVAANFTGVTSTTIASYAVQMQNQAMATIRNSNFTGATTAAMYLQSNSSLDVDSTVVIANSPTVLRLDGSALPAGAVQIAAASSTTLHTVELMGTFPMDLTLIPDPLQTGDSVWNMVGGITIADNTTMTLTAGTVIKSKNGSDITVATDSDANGVGGTLLVNGTAAAPVTITSLYDDTVTGDTNGDVAATTPSRGNWGSIHFREKSTGSIEYLHLKYGHESFYIAGASPTIANTTIESSYYGLYLYGNANSATSPVISNLSVQNSYYNAIYMYGYSGNVAPQLSDIAITRTTGIYSSNADIEGIYDVTANFTGVTATTMALYTVNLGNQADAVIRNSTLSGATSAAIFLQSGATLDVDNTVVIANSPTVLRLNGTALPSGVVQLAAASTATLHTVEITGTFATNVTLTPDPLQTGDSIWNMVGNITIADNATMTFSTGTVIKSKTGSDITVATDSDSNGVGGTLLVNGTAVDPVIITSLYDDTVVGDSNADGNATQPGSNNWGAIRFSNNSSGNISHLHLYYGSESIYLSGASPTLDNIVIGNAQYGIYLYGSGSAVTSPVISNLTITDTTRSIYMYGASGGVIAPTFTGTNTINQLSTFYPVIEMWEATTTPSFSGMTITGGKNAVAYYTGAAGTVTSSSFQSATDAVIYLADGSSPLFDDTVIVADTPVAIRSADTLPATSVLAATYSNSSAILLDSLSLSLDTQISKDPLGTGSSIWLLNGSLGVNDNATLTINAGTVFKFMSGNITLKQDSDLDGVGGILVVNGTSIEPVIFTSYEDDSINGDSNGDGTATVAAANNWTGIVMSAGSTATLSHAQINYSYQAIKASAASVTADNVVVKYPSQHGLYLLAGAGQSASGTITNFYVENGNGSVVEFDGGTSGGTVSVTMDSGHLVTSSSTSAAVIKINGSATTVDITNMVTDGGKHGLYFSNSATGQITRNIFRRSNNYGIYVSTDKQLTIRQNNILNNTGGIWVDNSGSNSRFSHNVIRNNTTTLNGGGVRLNDTDGSLSEWYNNLIIENKSPKGGGFYMAASAAAELVNNTIAKNVVTGTATGGGLFTETAAVVTITDNIIAHNDDSVAGLLAGDDVAGTGTLTSSNNLTMDGVLTGSQDLTVADAGFTLGWYLDRTLPSAAIDSGSTGVLPGFLSTLTTPTTDISAPVVTDTSLADFVDMGYHYNNPAIIPANVAVVAPKTILSLNETVIVTASAIDAGASQLGKPLAGAGFDFAVTADNGTISNVINFGDGSYQFDYKAPATSGSALLEVTVNGVVGSLSLSY